MSHALGTPKYQPIGQLLVELGYLSTDDLKRVLALQKKAPEGKRKSVGALCVEIGYLSKARLDFILERWGKRLKLGELLVNRGRITPHDLEFVLGEQRRIGGKLGDVLLNTGLIDEAVLAQTLAEQHDLPYVSLTGMRPRPELGRFVNSLYAARCGVVPIARIGSLLTVATSDPTRREVRQDLEQSTGLKIELVVATRADIEAFARGLYEFGHAGALMPHQPASQAPEGQLPSEAASDSEASSRAAEALLRRIVAGAVSENATELQIGCDGDALMVRVRVDGALREWKRLKEASVPPRTLLRMLKVMAGLDVLETKGTQEGVLVVETGSAKPGGRVALRMSLTSSPTGESAALHILDQRRAVPPLDQIGLRDAVCHGLESILEEAGGVLLIAGLKGSGKRTTLRALLGRLVAKGKVVDTIEDPILYPIEGVFQAQVNPRKRNSYAEHLERILALNPDAILIDRIQDGTLARLVFDGSHGRPLIISTVQASDCATPVMRMMQLGVTPTQMASSLRAVLSQRLLRRNCPRCLATYVPEASVIDEWFQTAPVDQVWWRGRGCELCSGIGFLDRIRLVEFWRLSDEERGWLAQGVQGAVLQQRVLERVGCHGQDALEHACKGRTTLEEATRVVPYEEIAFARARGPGQPVQAASRRAA